jgi:hypothetical protein
MRLGVKPAVFLGRLLFFFFLTYVLWKPIAPLYTQGLATLTAGFLHLTEISRDPNLDRATEMSVREDREGRPAIMYRHRLMPRTVAPQGIPADWVQANLVLLIPLMLATPARSYAQRFGRLGLALAIALVLQILDIAVTVKSFYASQLGTYSFTYYSDWARRLYQFGDAFTQAMDTQLFPVAIWAGIHFRQLLGREAALPAAAPPAASHAPRRKRKGAKRAADAGGRVR